MNMFILSLFLIIIAIEGYYIHNFYIQSEKWKEMYSKEKWGHVCKNGLKNEQVTSKKFESNDDEVIYRCDCGAYFKK